MKGWVLWKLQYFAYFCWVWKDSKWAHDGPLKPCRETHTSQYDLSHSIHIAFLMDIWDLTHGERTRFRHPSFTHTLTWQNNFFFFTALFPPLVSSTLQRGHANKTYFITHYYPSRSHRKYSGARNKKPWISVNQSSCQHRYVVPLEINMYSVERYRNVPEIFTNAFLMVIINQFCWNNKSWVK